MSKFPAVDVWNKKLFAQVISKLKIEDTKRPDSYSPMTKTKNVTIVQKFMRDRFEFSKKFKCHASFDNNMIKDLRDDL